MPSFFGKFNVFALVEYNIETIFYKVVFNKKIKKNTTAGEFSDK